MLHFILLAFLVIEILRILPFKLLGTLLLRLLNTSFELVNLGFLLLVELINHLFLFLLNLLLLLLVLAVSRFLVLFASFITVFKFSKLPLAFESSKTFRSSFCFHTISTDPTVRS